MARVLIVEDEHLLRRVITLNLVRRNHTVVETDSVASAEEALAVWNDAFDVILLDINLPDQTGWDVLRHVAKRLESATSRVGAIPRVIVMTAVHLPQCRIEEFHPDAVLIKPFPLQALLRLIEHAPASTPSEIESWADEEVADELTDSSLGSPPDAIIRAPPTP